MPQEEWDAMASELLNFVFNPLETLQDKDAEARYRLQRTRTFLQMKFGHVPALQEEMEALRRWKEDMMSAVVRDSERRTPSIQDPFSYHPDQGDD